MAQPVLDHPPTLSAALTLNLHSVGLSDEQFTRLVTDNPDLRFELTADRELLVMAPAGGETGNRNGRINQSLFNWTDQDGGGLAFDSSTGFVLGNGAKRSPDAAWVRRERWDALSQAEREGFPPLCPDFVLELRSATDNVKTLQNKMQEYIDNGAQLGWLLDPQSKRVYVYRPSQHVEVLEDPTEIKGDPVLPGFVLTLKDVWG